MGDDGTRDRALAALYLNLAEAFKDNNTNGVIIAKARLEKALRNKDNEDKHPLYSSVKDKVVSYPEKIAEMDELKEDLFFQLSDNSNESIKTIREFTVEEVIHFNKRILEKLKRKNKKTD